MDGRPRPTGTRLAPTLPDDPNAPSRIENAMKDSRVNQPRDPEIDRPESPDIEPGRELPGITPPQEPGIAQPRSPDVPVPESPEVEPSKRETEHPERERPAPPA